MKLAIDENRCKGCNLCTKVCPYKIFKEGRKLNRKGVAIPELTGRSAAPTAVSATCTGGSSAASASSPARTRRSTGSTRNRTNPTRWRLNIDAD